MKVFLIVLVLTFLTWNCLADEIFGKLDAPGLTCDCSKYNRILRMSYCFTLLSTECKSNDKVKPNRNVNSVACDRTNDLYSDGVYLKSVCTLEKDLDYAQAKMACADLGTSLFIISDEADEAK